MCHRDINYLVQYEQGKANLLYLLHVTPIIDHFNISLIATCIEEDPTLAQLLKIVKSGKKWIPKFSSVKLKKFEPVLNEITMTGNIALLQSERIILPEKL